LANGIAPDIIRTCSLSDVVILFSLGLCRQIRLSPSHELPWQIFYSCALLHMSHNWNVPLGQVVTCSVPVHCAFSDAWLLSVAVLMQINQCTVSEVVTRTQLGFCTTL